MYETDEFLVEISKCIEYYNLNETLEVLRKEAKLPPTNAVSEYIKLFKQGDVEMFFCLWQDHGLVNKQLEILLQVYFAIYPLLYAQQDSKSMERFKQFLEEKREWAQEPEFLQYYALPYLPDPKTHPTFRTLFEKEWVEQLELDLTEFLGTRSKTPPKLLTLLSDSKRPKPISRPGTTKPSPQLEQELATIKLQLQESIGRERDVLTKLKTVRHDYHLLLNVSTELVSTLMQAINQEPIDPIYLSDIVKRLGSLKKSGGQSAGNIVGSSKVVETPSKPVSKEPLPSIPPSYPQPVPPMPNAVQQPLIEQLDYPYIQQSLMKPKQDDTIVRLLQSLRAFLSDPSSRLANLDSLINHDFLGMTESIVVPFLVRHSTFQIREEASKLLNCLGSYCRGREYLTSQMVVKDLVQVLKLETGDTTIRQNLLGALQKLSLRRKAQSMMNQAGVISYIIGIFETLDGISEYTIEYGSALLMNLCLRTSGKQEACMYPETTLRVLNQLMDYDNTQVRTYTNGCLYSLFSDSRMRECAIEMGIKEQLEYLKLGADASLAKQIDFVIEKLQQEDDELSEIESEDGEEGDDPDEDVDEDPEQDLVIDTDLLSQFTITHTTKTKPSPKKKMVKQSSLTSQQLESMQIQLPVLESTKKGKLNMPISKQEFFVLTRKEEFNFGFATRPKVPRTPI